MIRLITSILDIKREMEKNHVGAYAAQSAYFIMLSFLPLIILLLSVIQFTGLGKADLYELIRDVIPLGFQSWLLGILDEMYSRTVATVSISALLTVWSAGKSFMALNKGMNVICKVERNPNYVLMRLRGAVFALMFAVLIVVTLLLIVFGTSIHELFAVYFPFLAIFTRVILSFRLVVMLALFMLFFALLYMILPNRRASFIEQFPGAIFAAAGWYLFSYGFSIYIEYSHAFNMYGSLTTLVLLMFWLYFVMYIVLIGMELNHLREEKSVGLRW
ncbi:MAG: YihY/virulence factor BrkB family protein [Lachnospiraceae bacterium]|jgi:membrane protein|nr:YihY/virulence factor BrkB family protein [Lachnospiraceae bacterium]MDE7058080.1 YihY/virulence factor BrkB family protein [Lachnospiraceae bacterium]